VVAIPNQPGYSFHEVYRTVPPPGAGLPQPYPHKNWKIVDGAVVELPAVKMPGVGVTSGMVLLEGVERFQIGSATNTEIPVHPRNVPGFWLDPTEVRAGDFLADSPKHVSLQLYGTPPQPTDAMAHVTFDQALAYAEKIGKRLDTEWEYEFAATNRGASAFPWGDNATLLASWPYGAAGTPAWERLPVEPPVFGLYSNVAEWTDSWNNLYPKYVREGLRLPFSTGDYPVVRGGPNSVIEGQPTAKDWLQGPRARTGRPRHDAQPGLGFRCARSKQPRLKPTDFSRVLDE
jgi:formylglycine-generating enzyme required for sulfatase activity